MSRKKSDQFPIDALLDCIQAKFNLKTRTEAVLMIGSNFPLITKIRKGYYEPSAEFILRTYDRTGLSIEAIRRILGVEKL